MCSKHIVETKLCGPLTVFVQGDVSVHEKKVVFLTVHDMGCNHTSFLDFVDHPTMKDVKERSVFIHVNVPGQEDNANVLADSFTFPSMQQLGEGLEQVLDHFNVQLVVGLAEGAGANIMARFGMACPNRLLGMLLVHCTSTKAGIMEHFNDKFMNWKLSSVGHNPSAEQYLVFHRFGSQLDKEGMDPSTREKLIGEFQEHLKTKINPKNLKRYVECFLERTDISALIKDLKVETLLMTGAKASHNHTVNTMHQHMNPAKTSIMTLNDIGDVLIEAPEKLADTLLLFCKGLGVLTTVQNPMRRLSNVSTDSSGVGVARSNRSMSMDDYDKPNLRRLSVTKT